VNDNIYIYKRKDCFIMPKEETVKNHSLALENRENLVITGITEVDTFDEREISLYTQLGELTIKGKNLHIDSISTETGEMTVTGDIWSIQYGDKDRQGPLSALGRLFR